MSASTARRESEPTSRTGNGITVVVDGDDLVVRGTVASFFGDAEDVESGDDNGIGASGFCYYPDAPEYLGCALPLRADVAGLEDSPLPREGVLPWFTPVRVFSHETGKVVETHLIDLGPEGGLNRGIDLLPAALAALGLSKAAGLYAGIDYRVIGGARYG